MTCWEEEEEEGWDIRFGLFISIVLEAAVFSYLCVQNPNKSTEQALLKNLLAVRVSIY
jgi:hypothetical protein